MASNSMLELDFEWFEDEKRTKDLKKSSDVTKWRLHVDSLKENLASLRRIVSLDQWSQDVDWVTQLKLADLGKIYSDYFKEKETLELLTNAGNDLLKTKVGEEQRTRLSAISNRFEETMKTWESKIPALNWVASLTNVLPKSLVGYCKLQDKQTQVLQAQQTLKTQMDTLVERRERPAKLKILIEKYIELHENYKANSSQQQKHRTTISKLFSRRVDENETQMQIQLQKWLGYIDGL